MSGTVSFGPEVLGQDETGPGKPSTLDSSAHVPRSLVVDTAFSWQDDKRPWHRYADTVLYEIHVKGFTMRHPGIPPPLRETYAGLGHDAAIAHLRDLGVKVLRHVSGMLNTDEITDEMYITVNTVKTHLKHQPQAGGSGPQRGGPPSPPVAELI